MMPNAVNGYAGAPQSIYCDEFLWPQTGEMGFKIEAAPLHPSLVATVLSQFGQDHFALFSQFPHIQGALALLRDGFSEQSQGGQVLLDEHQYPKTMTVMLPTKWTWNSGICWDVGTLPRDTCGKCEDDEDSQ